ncbi:chalcone-flavanone isomerase family protein [Artemisia annua]|uniref:Chalcone-flavanone isomerase family protein n=1 Tax=Artemisia annua TaxID=35608 RepID=A0A2U1NFT5_ARTAN|nr:chalcone-flavanone isomerase family protein [Artemisia annua]
MARWKGRVGLPTSLVGLESFENSFSLTGLPIIKRKPRIIREKKLFIMNLGEGQPKFLPVESLTPGRYLYHISSLVDNNSRYHSGRFFNPGNVTLQETFRCISKFTGNVLLWYASGSSLNNNHTLPDSSRDSYPKRSGLSSKASYVSSNKRDLPRFFIGYRRKALEIPEFLNKFSRSAVKQLFGMAKDLQFIPAMALAGNLVPPLSNTSRNFFAVSHETNNAVVERSMNHSPCEVEQRRCGDIKFGSSNCSASAVEPRTGIEFPTILDNIFGGGKSNFNTEVLVGTGSKTMKIIKIKSLKLYAFGFYVHPYDVCNKLGSKYASLPDNEVKTHDNFFSDLLREDISMTLRLVVSCNGIKISTVRDAFEKSLQARLIKMNPDTDYDCLKSFGSLFKEDIPLRAGTTIKIQRTADGHLVTEIEGNRIGAVQSKDLCTSAVEPRTGIEFPTILDNIFGGGKSNFNTEVLVGTGSKTMKIIKIKSLKLYAFGFYVHPYDVCNKLGSKYASLPDNEVKTHDNFFSDLLREDISMTLRLVVSCNGIKISTVRDAFEKSLQARLIKMNPDTDYDCLKSFGSLFKEDIPLRAGTTIKIQRTADGHLVTEIEGNRIGAVQSKDLCRAFFDMYIGDGPVSEETKTEIGENVALLCGCGINVYKNKDKKKRLVIKVKLVERLGP